MRVLWITNIIFPEVIGHFSGSSALKSTGGWLIGLSDSLSKREGVTLGIINITNLVNKPEKLVCGNIIHYVLPNNIKTKYWQFVKSDFLPDVIHIHGTETVYGFSYINSCGADKTIVSIQGLIGPCSKYYNDGISYEDIVKSFTISDIISGGIIGAKRKLKRYGPTEQRFIESVDHIIGRTDWDRAHVWSINPGAHYHFCNEILRSEFYGPEKWSYAMCNKHTLFMSQGANPIKGLLQVIRALPLVLRFYPNTILRVAGRDIRKRNSIRDYYHFSNYPQLINRYITKYKLQNNIVFTGPLDAGEMKREYLGANVFVCPSAIENSPNSLGEAQILGVPSIASYVGGVPNMIPEKNCGKMYRFEETEMLALYICEMFEESKFFNNLGMIRTAEKRHSRAEIVSNLLAIYNNVIHEH